MTSEDNKKILAEMTEILRVSKRAQDFNNIFNKELKSVRETINRSKEREQRIKTRIGEEVENNLKREEEIENLMDELRKTFDRNMRRVKEYNEKKLSSVLEQHRKEIQKWKERYSSLREESVKNNNNITDSHEKQMLEDKISSLEKNISAQKKKNDLLEAEISDIQNEKRKAQDELKQLKQSTTSNKSEISSKDSEISRLKRDITELKNQIKYNQDQIKNCKNERDEEIKRWKDKYESIKTDFEKFRNEKLDASSSSCSSSSKDLNYYHDELKIAQIEIHSMKRKLETKAGVIETLHATIQKKEKLINELEEKLVEEAEQVKINSTKLSFFRDELAEKKLQIEEKDRELKRIKQEFEEKDLKCASTRKDLDKVLENENKWKEKATRMEERVACLLKEIEDCKRQNVSLNVNIERKQIDFEKLKTEKSRLEKQSTTLKKLCSDLENELQTYHSTLANVTSSKKELVKEKGNWSSEVHTLKKDLDNALDRIQSLNDDREELQSMLNFKDAEIEGEKSEIKYLNDRLKDEQIRYLKLEEELSEYKRSDRNVDNLRAELSNIKEEASTYLTKITLLEREQYCLSGKYAAAKEREKDLKKRINELTRELEESERKIKEQKKVFIEQEAQQMKLIQYLQEQIEQNEKKKKPFLCINSKLVGEEGSKSLKAEQDKNRRLNEELDNLKKDYDKTLNEVRQLKSQLVELHNNHDRAMFNEIPCKFNHNFDIVSIEGSIFRKCFKCGKKLHKSARKCRSCGIMSHVDCKIEAGTCGVNSKPFESASETTPIQSDGSSDDGSSRHLMFATAPIDNSESEVEEIENIDGMTRKLKEIEEQFYIDNNLSTSKRKSYKSKSSSKRTKTNAEKQFSFSDSVFKDILE